MTVHVAGENDALNGAGGTTLTVAYTPSVGSFLEVYTSCVGGTTSSVTDGTNTYTSRLSVTDTPDNTVTQLFTSGKINSGAALTIQANFSTTVTDRTIWVKEIAGAQGLLTANIAGQAQASPGTGANGISTGLLGTLSAQPALISALAFDSALTGGQPAAGTGFTQGTSAGGYWGSLAISESLRVTATTSIAATFTANTNVEHTSLGCAWQEAVPSSWQTIRRKINTLLRM